MSPVLAKMRPAQWVTLHNIQAYTFFFVRCGLLIIVVAQLPVFMQEQLVSSCSESAGGRTSLLEAALR